MAIDLPGFGLSSPLQDNPTVANYVEVLREFINKKGLERVRLCGHSFGALLCRALFASFPKQVERVMLISAPLPGAVNPIADGTMNLMLFGYARRDCLTDKDFKVFRDLNLGTPEGLRRIARFPDFEDKLSFDGSRCMLLHGEFDRIVSLDVAGCEDAFPGADLQVLNGVGHVPHEEAPETILRKMKPFFAGSCV